MRAKRPGESALLLRDAVDILAQVGIPYDVIGAMAASMHGIVRASMDADAVLAASPSGLAALEECFRRLRLRTDLRHGDAIDLNLLQKLAADFGRETSDTLEKLVGRPVNQPNS
jgi:hypothetical protein